MVKKYPTKNAICAHVEKHKKSHGRVWCLEDPVSLQQPMNKRGAQGVSCGSMWRLLLAAPGFHHESPHNHHQYGGQTQSDEVAHGVIPRRGIWGSWEREEDEHQLERSIPPSHVDLPNVTLLHLLVLPGQWSAAPSLTL